jgi:signal-transduction protein with cAMP-binding, CBS, and nucleotidyltransferase domain
MSDEVTLPVELTEEEKGQFLAICEVRESAPDEEIYAQGDPGGSLWVVLDGAVEIRARITDDVEKNFSTLRAGGILGILPFIDGGVQPASAVAVEPSRLLVLTRDAFHEFCEAQPVIGLKFLRYMVSTMSVQVRLTVEQYLRTAEWNLQVSGVMDLNLRGLVADRPDVRLDLTNGGQVIGCLLKFEESPAGHELLVRTIDGELVMVPYHAVAVLSLTGGKEG